MAAPLVVIFPFTDFGDAIKHVNDSFFGLQTGVFTNDLGHAWQAFGELEVGGVIVNDIPTYRVPSARERTYGGSWEFRSLPDGCPEAPISVACLPISPPLLRLPRARRSKPPDADGARAASSASCCFCSC